MTDRPWRIAGICFEHFHMGDNLAFAREHPRAEIVGLCDRDPDRVEPIRRKLELDDVPVFVDPSECIEATQPDLLIVCPSTAGHREWVERLAPYEIPILMEKPMAATLADADAMIAAVANDERRLMINWPLAWYPCHRTAYRLVQEGAIGDVLEVHYYDGNRGPLWHTSGKEERTAEEVAREKPRSWFYRRAAGGGSLLDYLGYGTTLGTWFLGGREPLEITAVVDEPPGLEVDEHAVVIARYAQGLSKFETRWGTFTDPWVHQPQPKCGFALVGTEGTLSSYDYESTVRLQDRRHPAGVDLPVDELPLALQNPIAHWIDCREQGGPLDGPMSLSICRIGQQMVDAAVVSSVEKRTVRFEEVEPSGRERPEGS